MTDFHSFTVNQDKLQNWSIFMNSAKVMGYDLFQNFNITKTS